MTHYATPLVRLFLLLTLIISGQATAEEPRLYDIELLIFRHLIQSDAGEMWPDADPESQVNDDIATDWLDNNTVTWLPDARQLGAQLASLKSSAQYRPIAHLAWRQSLQDRQDALPLRLPAGAAAMGDAQLEGSVTVALERYLHLSLDLVLQERIATQTPETGFYQAVESIRLTGQRRMRSGEIHYFDNPRFGVLALITPYEAPP